MDLYARCINGFKLANTSFSLAWKYKPLFIYTAITTLVTLGTISIALIMQGQFELGHLLTTFQVGVRHLSTNTLLRFFVTAFVLLIDFLLTVSLIYHFLKLTRHQKTTAQENIQAGISKITTIAVFALLSATMWLVWMYVPSSVQEAPDIKLWFIETTILLAWNMIMILVLPIIAFESIGFLDILARALSIIVHLLPEFVIGGIWLLIVYAALGILFDAPVILAAKLVSPDITSSSILPAFALLLTGILTVYMQSVGAIYSTLIYQLYKQQQ
ncbi:MAG TPA: hypothetical protein VFF04_03520 [Candidatus Babeliales bacterium]|nr:hypothetical protein [Candidatus Babeliales bacterium]